MLGSSFSELSKALTIAKARRVRVNSGPREAIIRRTNENTKHLMATEVGMVMTTAAETSRNAQIKPEIWGPVSENIITMNDLEYCHFKAKYLEVLLGMGRRKQQ